MKVSVETLYNIGLTEREAKTALMGILEVFFLHSAGNSEIPESIDLAENLWEAIT